MGQNEALEVSLQTAIQDLSDRVKQLEQTTAVTDRETREYLPCPFCGLKGQPVVMRFAENDHCNVACLNCGSRGPNTINPKEAIWSWNQFVSHRGKLLPSITNNLPQKDADYKKVLL